MGEWVRMPGKGNPQIPRKEWAFRVELKTTAIARTATTIMTKIPSQDESTNQYSKVCIKQRKPDPK